MLFYAAALQTLNYDWDTLPGTASYRERGVYHGKNLHLKAHRFRVADQDS